MQSLISKTTPILFLSKIHPVDSTPNYMFYLRIHLKAKTLLVSQPRMPNLFSELHLPRISIISFDLLAGKSSKKSSLLKTEHCLSAIIRQNLILVLLAVQAEAVLCLRMPELGAFASGNPPRWANREGAMDVLIVFLCIKGNFTKQSLVTIFFV